MECLPKDITINCVIPYLTYKERIKLYSVNKWFWAMNTGEYIWIQQCVLSISHMASYNVYLFKLRLRYAHITLNVYPNGKVEMVSGTVYETFGENGKKYNRINRKRVEAKLWEYFDQFGPKYNFFNKKLKKT